MKINKEFIKKFNPCPDRWENYLNHYSGFEGSWVDFLELDKITAFDKIWVFSMPTKDIEKHQREFALMCAARAVDNCKVIEVEEFFNLQILIVQNSLWELKDSASYRAADSAANRAANSAANSAADSASYRAADSAANRTAYSAAAWTAYSAAYSAANSAADSAACYAAYWSAYSAARKVEQEIQVEMIKTLMWEI